MPDVPTDQRPEPAPWSWAAHLREVIRDRGKGSRLRRLLRILVKGIGYRVLRRFRSDHWVRFRCNICGFANVMPRDTVSSRDRPSCISCYSPLRLRTVIHALSTELFGASLLLGDFPHSPNVRGVGLSDWEGYAEGLSKKLDYTNTFYDEDPVLDLTQEIEPAMAATLDFVIATDVFEHIAPPVSVAFANLRKLLKEDGVLIFSVPYKKEGETEEHFSDAAQAEWALQTASSAGDGQIRFHAGPGLTLEMRLFSEPALVRQLKKAGFESLRFYRYDQPRWGIISDEAISLVIAARQASPKGQNSPSPGEAKPHPASGEA